MACGRDAADVALSTSFGPSRLSGFKVVTDELSQESGGFGLISAHRAL